MSSFLTFDQMQLPASVLSRNSGTESNPISGLSQDLSGESSEAIRRRDSDRLGYRSNSTGEG